MSLVDDVCTLVDVVIINCTQIDLVSHAIFFGGVVVIIVIEMKNDLCHDPFLRDMLLLLVRKVFKCLHQHVDEFFIDVRTWHGEQKGLRAFHFQFCVHFISRKCQ